MGVVRIGANSTERQPFFLPGLLRAVPTWKRKTPARFLFGSTYAMIVEFHAHGDALWEALE